MAAGPVAAPAVSDAEKIDGILGTLQRNYVGLYSRLISKRDTVNRVMFLERELNDIGAKRRYGRTTQERAGRIQYLLGELLELYKRAPSYDEDVTWPTQDFDIPHNIQEKLKESLEAGLAVIEHYIKSRSTVLDGYNVELRHERDADVIVSIKDEIRHEERILRILRRRRQEVLMRLIREQQGMPSAGNIDRVATVRRLEGMAGIVRALRERVSRLETEFENECVDPGVERGHLVRVPV
jgi:hypothetical protein